MMVEAYAKQSTNIIIILHTKVITKIYKIKGYLLLNSSPLFYKFGVHKVSNF